MKSFSNKHASKLLFVTLNAIAVFFITQALQNPVIKDVQTSLEAILSPTPQVAGEAIEESELYLVTKVIDGDTIELENGQKVRYIGIDTPEVQGDCYANEATNKNKELVLNKKVSLIKDKSEVDRYGRLLRYVYVNDIFVNNTLVREGFAFAKQYPPDTQYAQQFSRAEEEAQEQGKGLWSDCGR